MTRYGEERLRASRWQPTVVQSAELRIGVSGPGYRWVAALVARCQGIDGAGGRVLPGKVGAAELHGGESEQRGGDAEHGNCGPPGRPVDDRVAVVVEHGQR